MKIELINTGSELLLGRVLNTHQQWIGRRLADRGYELTCQVAVPDTADAIQRAVEEALGRSDLVITTGGLGPTSDDRTRELIAEMLNRPLREDAAIVRHIESFFQGRGRTMPQSVRVQAMVPEGARVIANDFGTAPGLAMTVAGESAFNGRAHLVMLPGPPRELRPMFDARVLPWLEAEVFAPVEFACRTLRSTGIGESRVEEKIKERLPSLFERGLEIGYCARTGEVDVRLIARGSGAAELVDEAVDGLLTLFRGAIYGQDDDVLEEILVRTLSGSVL